MRASRVKKLEQFSKPKRTGWSRVETIVINEGEPMTEEQKALKAEVENDPEALLIIRTIVSPKR
jgi:hypothetical protein